MTEQTNTPAPTSACSSFPEPGYTGFRVTAGVGGTCAGNAQTLLDLLRDVYANHPDEKQNGPDDGRGNDWLQVDVHPDDVTVTALFAPRTPVLDPAENIRPAFLRRLAARFRDALGSDATITHIHVQKL